MQLIRRGAWALVGLVLAVARPALADGPPAVSPASSPASSHAEKAAQGRARAEADAAARTQGLREDPSWKHPPPPPPVVDTRPTVRRWYGWQVVGADLLGVVLVLASPEPAPDNMPLLLGLGVYALDGAVVHLGHGRPLAAFGSLGLRAGLAVGGALLGDVLCEPGPGMDDVCLVEHVIGFGLGGLAAMAIDWVWLSHEEVRVGAPLQVGLVPRDDGLALTLGGTF